MNIKREVARYLLPVVATGVALLLIVAVAPLQQITYSLFLFAVVATAILGGLAPALMATALALAAMNYADYLQRGHFNLDLDDFVQFTIFAGMAVTVSLLTAQRRRARLEAEKANARLRELDHAKDQFIANVSHELKTPVTVILGWAMLLQQSDGESLRPQAATAIEQSARAQARLIEDLLDMSRIILGKLQLQIVPIGLVEVLRQSVAMIRPAAESHEISVDLALPREPCVVLGDEVRLKQICWNLLSNAMKFTPPGGRVDVTLTRDDGSARITISDTGEGIPSDLLQAIFEPLKQGNSGLAKGGLGLGLAIVHELVTMHHGSIEAHSDGAGKGARFVVRLPLNEIMESGRLPAGKRPIVTNHGQSGENDRLRQM